MILLRVSNNTEVHMLRQNALTTLAKVQKILDSSEAQEVSKATDKALRSLARACGVFISKPSKARTYGDGYMSMSSMGVALKCPFPQWRNVQRALMKKGYLVKDSESPQPRLTPAGKEWGRLYDEGDKRWRVWKPETVEHIRELVERYNAESAKDSE